MGSPLKEGKVRLEVDKMICLVVWFLFKFRPIFAANFQFPILNSILFKKEKFDVFFFDCGMQYLSLRMIYFNVKDFYSKEILIL